MIARRSKRQYTELTQVRRIVITSDFLDFVFEAGGKTPLDCSAISRRFSRFVWRGPSFGSPRNHLHRMKTAVVSTGTLPRVIFLSCC